MNKILNDKIFTEMKAQVCALIDENKERLIEARNAALIAHVEAGGRLTKAKYAFALTVVQIPRGDECDVFSKIGYTVVHKDETDKTTVSDHPELPLGDKKDEPLTAGSKNAAIKKAADRLKATIKKKPIVSKK